MKLEQLYCAVCNRKSGMTASKKFAKTFYLCPSCAWRTAKSIQGSLCGYIVAVRKTALDDYVYKELEKACYYCAKCTRKLEKEK